MPASDKTYPYAEFRAHILAIGKKTVTDEAAFEAKLNEKERKFKLMDDGGFDSLDVVESVMELERLLDEEGWGTVEIPQDELEKAENIGDIYLCVCKALKVQPS